MKLYYSWRQLLTVFYIMFLGLYYMISWWAGGQYPSGEIQGEECDKWCGTTSQNIKRKPLTSESLSYSLVDLMSIDLYEYLKNIIQAKNLYYLDRDPEP